MDDHRRVALGRVGPGKRTERSQLRERTALTLLRLKRAANTPHPSKLGVRFRGGEALGVAGTGCHPSKRPRRCSRPPLARYFVRYGAARAGWFRCLGRRRSVEWCYRCRHVSRVAFFPEQEAMRVVGRRRPPAKLALGTDTKVAARAWRRAFPTPFVKRGVYRFASHEEADRSLWEMITRPRTT